MIIKSLAISIVVVFALAGCKADQTPDASAPVATADTGAGKEPAAAAESASATSASPEAEAMPTPIPETADAIWLAIDQHSAELKAAVQGGSLDSVHHHAFAIRDLVAALPSRSPTLPAEEQDKLKNEVQFVATLADRLDQTGDAGDRAGAQANYDKLVTVLNGITRTK